MAADGVVEDPRATARRLVEVIARDAPLMTVHRGIDLAPAIEQALFGRLRRPKRTAPAPTLRSMGRLAWHGLSALRTSATPQPGDVVVLVVNPAHARIFEPVAARLAAEGVGTFTAFESHARGQGGARPGSGRLVDRLRPAHAAELVRFEARARLALRGATRGFAEVVDAQTGERMREAVAETIGRIGLYASCLDDIARRRPSLLVAFNEVGRWSRILPVVARRHGIPSLDIAHAEVVDVAAVEGADYDRFAVFGPRSVESLERAGIESSRIVITGAPRFDSLIRTHRELHGPPTARRIVFASQWLGGAMSELVKVKTVAAAVAAATAVAPAELVIQSHPIERDDIATRVADSARLEGVRVRVGSPGGLHAELDGAWLLVTGWSNAVFEAILSNVPALTINATGHSSPMPFAEEGISVGATDADSAGEAARALLSADRWRDELRRARAALADHLGPLDGAATDRVTSLILSMRRPASPSPDEPSPS